MVRPRISASVLFLASVQFAKSQECDRTVQGPISLPIKNVTLAGNHIRRGLEVHLGTPPQPLAIAVSGYYNNSFIYDASGQCGSISTGECTAIRGGAFVESLSSSLSSSLKFSDFSTLDQQAGVTTDTVLTGSDTLTINGSFVVEQYPFGTPRTDKMQFLDYSVLGMGKDSSLMTMLWNQGSIASRSFSLYWGQTGTTSDHQLDGNLVIGGLDEAKTSGSNYTTKLDHSSPCPTGMLISVSDISLEFPNGTSASIMAANIGQSINFCIAPEFPMMTVPPDMFDQWIEAHPQSATDGGPDARAGGFPNLWGLVYEPDLIFDGDLKITVDSSLAITVPNHQLVQYYYTFDSNGDAVVNDTVLELMANPLVEVNSKDLPKLGMTFLQAAYLHVNYDEDTLTLWQANPTTDQSLVGVGKSTRGCATVSNSTSSPTSEPASASSSASPPKPSSPSGGAIAGIVISVLAFIAIIIAAIWWYLRFRRSKTTKQGLQDAQTGYRNDPSRYSAPMYNKWELDGSSSSAPSRSQEQENPLPTLHQEKPLPTVHAAIEMPVERYVD